MKTVNKKIGSLTISNDALLESLEAKSQEPLTQQKLKEGKLHFTELLMFYEYIKMVREKIREKHLPQGKIIIEEYAKRYLEATSETLDYLAKTMKTSTQKIQDIVDKVQKMLYSNCPLN